MNDSVTMKSLLVIDTPDNCLADCPLLVEDTCEHCYISGKAIDNCLPPPDDCPLLRICTVSNVEGINSAINNIEDVLSGGDEIYPSTLNNALNALTILKRILSV